MHEHNNRNKNNIRQKLLLCYHLMKRKKLFGQSNNKRKLGVCFNEQQEDNFHPREYSWSSDRTNSSFGLKKIISEN